MIKKIIAITLIFLTSITVNAQTPTRSTMKMCSNGKLAINCVYFDNKSDTKSNTKPSTTTGSNTYGPNLPSTTTRRPSSIIYNANGNFGALRTNGKPPVKPTNRPTNQTQCPKKPVSSIANSTINTNSNSTTKDKITAGSPLPTNRNSNPNCPTQPTKSTVSLNVASCTKNPKLSLKCKEILEIDTCKKTPSTPSTTRCQTLLKPSDKVANAKANLAITTARRQFLLCTPKYIAISEANKAKCDTAKKTIQTANSVANSTRANTGNSTNGTTRTNSTLASNNSNRQNTNANPSNLSNNNPTQAGIVPQDNQASPANTPNTPTAGSGIFGNLLQRGLDSGLLSNITGRIFGGRNKDQAQQEPATPTQPEPTLGSTPVDSTATQLANTPITSQAQNICITDPTKCSDKILRTGDDTNNILKSKKSIEIAPRQEIAQKVATIPQEYSPQSETKLYKLMPGFVNPLRHSSDKNKSNGEKSDKYTLMTFDFGQRFGSPHRGSDIICMPFPNADYKCETVAMCTGVISEITFYSGRGNYGNYVGLDCGGENIYYYAHLSSVLVKKGQMVKQGEAIGREGTTTTDINIHLHIEVRRREDDVAVSPCKTIFTNCNPRKS